MARYLVLRNACVVDPVQGIDCDIMDICVDVESGRIVDCSEAHGQVETIDVGGRLTMAGGIDIHTHVAGPKINIARLMRPEDHYRTNVPSVSYPRAHCGKSTPTVLRTGYRYAQMGYTLICEAASPPLKTRHTHEELDDTPIVDKLVYVLFDSTWLGLDYIVEKDVESLALYVAWMLDSLKGYAIKLVDPGADMAWFHGYGLYFDIDDQVPEYGVTPREIMYYYSRVAQILNLPHSIHVHTNKLGIPGNYTTLLETFRTGESSVFKNRLVLHVTHVQFSSYRGDCWYNFAAASDEIVKELERSPHVSIDLGQVSFGETTTMTADAPFEFILYHLRKWKVVLHDIEAETATGIVPYNYKRRSVVNAIQWSIGLEVALLASDNLRWRIVLSSDHPNAGPFTRYPLIMTWLMSRRAREREMEKMPRKAVRRMILPSIDSEYTFRDIAIITRAAPARILGLQDRGTLKPGAVADIAVYDIDPRNIDPSSEHDKVYNSLRRAWLVLKDGRTVVREGKVVQEVSGRTLYVKCRVPKRRMSRVVREIEERFRKYYSIHIASFVISSREIHNPSPIITNADLRE
ncbi:MAG: formylmethanofuran dehydrogenase subunit A [Crenarchaeota archaeon]|nr:formylmethanofuran dehydrogenase subunit A [Thermoproteota archaeon]